ncbi:MAG: PAS domain S-box protein [Proteobacteria bacterium]|nr:PAS domain S-box protein [Pseudomonadota bacterium]
MIEHNETHNDADKAKDAEARVNLSFFRSMRGKILGLFLAFAILPSLFAVGFSYQQISHALEDRIKNELKRTARLQAAHLDAMFDECIKDMRVVAATDEVRSMAPQGIHRATASFNQLWKRYTGITIYRADGYAVAESIRTPEETRKAHQNIADREYFQKAVCGEETISDTVMAKSGEGLVTTIAVPIYRKGIIGVAAADITVDAIALSLYESRFGWTGNVYLVDREGNFIWPSRFSEESLQKEFINKQTQLELRVDMFGTQKALAGNPEASIYYNYRGREVLGSYIHIPRTGWGLFIEQETEEALASVRRLRNISILVGLMFAGLATGIAVFISGGMIKNTVRLTRAASELRKGNLAVRADVTSTDELGQLAENFNSMADRITTLVSKLEQQIVKQTAANEALHREIAERKQAEELLRKSEVRYRSLFDGVPVALYRSTPAGQSLDVNTAMVEMFGSPDRETMLALNVTELYADPEDRVWWKALMEQEGLACDFEFQARRLDGRLLWVKKTSRVVKDDQGQAVYYEGSLEDITERKRAEEAVRQERERFQIVSENAPLGMAMIGKDGAFKYINPRFKELFGYDLEDIPDGRTWFRKAFPDHEYRHNVIAVWLNQFQDAQGKKPREAPSVFNTTCKDGTTKVISYLGVTLETGEHIMTCEDITERVRAEEVLKKHHEQLLREIETRKNFERELEKSRGQLRRLSEHLQQAREAERTRIAREFHDELGQSLSALKIDLTCLGNGMPEDYASLREQTKTMEVRIDDAINTVRTICSRLRPPMLDHFGLPATLQWYLQDFEKRTGITCSAEIDQNISVKDKDLALVVFRIVQEAMTNILRHAAARNVTVTLNKKGPGLALKVEDDGKGISEEEVSNPRSLGIIGIQERIRFWDGRVQFQGRPGRGTTMIIWIPIGRHKRNASAKGFETREEGTL